MSGRAYHHGNLRAELIEQAWQEIEDAGVEGLSLRQLARQVGVSHGASARHFADKQALLDAVAVEGFRALNTALLAAAAGDDVRQRFHSVGLAYVGFAIEHPRILAVMYSAKHKPGASGELAELSHAGMRSLVAMIADAQQAGLIGSGDPDRLATAAFAAVHGVAILATDDLLNATPADEAAATTVEVVWRGLTVGIGGPGVDATRGA